MSYRNDVFGYVYNAELFSTPELKMFELINRYSNHSDYQHRASDTREECIINAKVFLMLFDFYLNDEAKSVMTPEKYADMYGKMFGFNQE